MKSTRRSYDNSKRAAAAARTREALIDAAVELLVEDPSALSLAGVARRAGLSAPTAHRHFASQAELEAAVHDRYTAELHAGLDTLEPGDREAMRSALRSIHRNHAALSPGLRALATSEISRRRRRERREASRDWIRRHLGAGLDHAPPDQARLAVDLGVVMATTGAARLFEEYLALTPDEAADRVAWFFELLADWAESHRPSHPPV
ncbi:MAG: TetR/AcrR family transcriptional regulator; helix-turn-helix transcriptional regulator [Caenispirillum sp.]|nr:TetR/AcrR family transcriptional regulator; helix-turn-helix transcriptional regulator [Caenispirillum sp.]